MVESGGGAYCAVCWRLGAELRIYVMCDGVNTPVSSTRG